MSIDEKPPTKYISYNGLGRSPVIWGIPYMFILSIGSWALLGGMRCGLSFGPAGWLFAALAIPVLIFIKVISATDDKAVNILLLEIKWVLIKFFKGNAAHFGGTLTIAPTTYGRKFKYVKKYFEKSIER